MDNQNQVFSQNLARQIKIRDLQGRWRRVSSLSLTDFEQLWNDTTNEIRDSRSLDESRNDDDLNFTD